MIDSRGSVELNPRYVDQTAQQHAVIEWDECTPYVGVHLGNVCEDIYSFESD